MYFTQYAPEVTFRSRFIATESRQIPAKQSPYSSIFRRNSSVPMQQFPSHPFLIHLHRPSEPKHHHRYVFRNSPSSYCHSKAFSVCLLLVADTLYHFFCQCLIEIPHNCIYLVIILPYNRQPVSILNNAIGDSIKTKFYWRYI